MTHNYRMEPTSQTRRLIDVVGEIGGKPNEIKQNSNQELS
jgi:hypothetical protein